MHASRSSSLPGSKRGNTSSSNKKKLRYSSAERRAMYCSPESRRTLTAEILRKEDPNLLKKCTTKKMNDLMLYKRFNASKYSRTKERNMNRDNVEIEYNVCKELFKLGKRNEFDLCIRTLDMATKEEYPSRFYKSIVWSFKTHEIKQLFTHLLDSALENEMDCNPATMLRIDCPATLLMSTILKEQTSAFLNHVCKPIISYLKKKKSKPFEIDPNRLNNEKLLAENRNQLLKLLRSLLKSIRSSLYLISNDIRELLKIVAEKCESKHKNSAINMVGSFLFLRYLSPAIIAPKNLKLVVDAPTPEQTRTLVLLVKCLQSIITGVSFDGSKEQYMKVLDSDLQNHHSEICTDIVTLLSEKAKKKHEFENQTIGLQQYYMTVSKFYYYYSSKIYNTTSSESLKVELEKLVPNVLSQPIYSSVTDNSSSEALSDMDYDTLGSKPSNEFEDELTSYSI